MLTGVVTIVYEKFSAQHLGLRNLVEMYIFKALFEHCKSTSANSDGRNKSILAILLVRQLFVCLFHLNQSRATRANAGCAHG